ncbi:phage antirepressor N-terminal domain-containing protein [Spirosoma litoris]
MTKQTKKFLEFNGRTLLFLAIDGTYWVAVKPICEALGVNYDRQYKNLKEDQILGGVYAKQPMHDSSGRIQQMISLPEKWVYGWLFSINSNSEQLLTFKQECYQVLYDHFHGPLAERIQTLHQKTEAELELERAMEALKETSAYKTVLAAQKKVKDSGRQLRNLDSQLSIWD